MTEPEVHVLISSAGRRNYLVEWFREALVRSGLVGSVNATDASRVAPGLVPADRAAVLPPYTSDEYEPALRATCRAWGVTLALSLNDFELSLWSGRLADGWRHDGVRVAGVSASVQAALEDKLAYADLFHDSTVSTPVTVTGRTALQQPNALAGPGGHVVVKNRFGSGSAGLAIVPVDDLAPALAAAATTARHRDGSLCTDPDEALDLLVVQPRLDGLELGLDVVNDLEGAHRGALARRKLSMRAGETDQAVSVDASDHAGLAATVAGVVGHRGLVDVDVLLTADGPVVIDVNPRFGGGYPFSHLAGADVPACYVAWAAGRDADPEWLTSAAGVTSAKFEGVTVSRAGLA